MDYVCTWINEVWAGGPPDCALDCTNEELWAMGTYDFMCEECLAESPGTCEDWMGGDDHVDCYMAEYDSEAACPLQGCAWNGNECVHWDEINCENYSDTTVPSCGSFNSCELQDDGTCTHYDGPPQCLLGCDGVLEISPEDDATGFCEWLTDPNGGIATGCSGGCDVDVQSEK